MIYKQHLSGGILRIIEDTLTGVLYLSSSGLGINGITPLLNKDGKIITSKNTNIL